MMFASKSLSLFRKSSRHVPRQFVSTFFPFNSLNTTTPSSTTTTAAAERSQNQVPNFSTKTAITTTGQAVNKTEIAEEIAKTHDISVASSKRILNTVLDSIVEAVGEGRPVRLQGFGSFDAYMSKERIGSHPITQEKMVYPARKRVRFRPSPAFKDA